MNELLTSRAVAAVQARMWPTFIHVMKLKAIVYPKDQKWAPNTNHVSAAWLFKYDP